MSPYESIPIGIPLSRYTATLSNAINSHPSLSGVWVIAELSDVRMSGGHCYLELIEKNEAGNTIAKLKANIWRSTYIQLRQKFVNATQREIATGIKAMVRGSANHHSLYGLSFNIIDIDPSYTMGDMERLRREIILRLQKEGLADLNKKLYLPMAPQRIAVISAEGAAGYGDFINHLIGNSEGFVFYPGLFPCVMQGDRVSESIRKALQIIESMPDMWDCIAIVRGGGATTDLNGFDDYELAKAIATCGLPVVVGIGHERDRNVLDELAHTSLKTPTAVAGFFIDCIRKAYDEVLYLSDKLRTYSTEMMRGEERRLSALITLIPQLGLRKIEESRSKIHTLTAKIPLCLQNRIGRENLKHQSFITLLSSAANNQIEREKIKTKNFIDLLYNLSQNKFVQSQVKVKSLEDLIAVLNPINTLKRGYSITRINGKALKTVNEIKDGDMLTTTLPDGKIISKVEKK